MKIRTHMDKAGAYLKAALRPSVAGKLFLAFFRGMTMIWQWHGDYVNGRDFPELKEKNPTSHHNLVRVRKWWRTGWAVLDLVALFACVKIFPAGLPMWIAGHIIVITLIGKNEPVMKPVQTKRMIGEALLRTVANEMTLTAGQVANGATAEIHSPPARLQKAPGYRATLRVAREGKPTDLLIHTATLAHKLKKGTGQVFTYQDKHDNSLIEFVVLDINPWETPPTKHPMINALRPVDLWSEECNLGLRPDFTFWTKILVAHGDGGGILAGGAPRRGKSNFISVLLIYLILDPMVDIHMIDGKALDFEAVKPVCKSFIGDEAMDDITLLTQATQVLESLKTELFKRKSILRSRKAKHITAELSKELNMKLQFVIIDELAVLTEDMMTSYKREAQYFTELLQYLVRMGPALGIYCILATQRPSAKSVPDSIRSMIIWRTAFYISSQPGSLAILGKAGANYRADWLDPDIKGIALSVGDGQVRPHMVETEDLELVTRYGLALRAGAMPTDNSVTNFIHPEIIRFMIQVLKDNGLDRTRTSDILEAIDTQFPGKWDATKLALELGKYGVKPTRFTDHEGIQRRGYLLADLQAAPRVIPLPVYTVSSPGSETATGKLETWQATERPEDKDNG